MSNYFWYEREGIPFELQDCIPIKCYKILKADKTQLIFMESIYPNRKIYKVIIP